MSIRRLSWRSLPSTYRPPRARTSSASAAHCSLNLAQQRLVALAALVGVEVEPLGADLVTGETLGVAAEEDVDATSGHVRRDRDRVQAPRLGDDRRLLGVVLGVQHVVRDALLVQEQGQLLGLGHRGRADEHRLALLVALLQVLDDRLELGGLGLEDQVRLVGRIIGRCVGIGTTCSW